jgi:hypothetical protein
MGEVLPAGIVVSLITEYSCSSLIPHAGIVVSLITEYFKGAKLPSIRRKLYTVVRLLLSSIGVGRWILIFSR